MCAFRAHVPTCLACLCAHVPTCLACLRAHVPCVLTCLRANVPYVFTCQRALRTYVLTCFACLLVNVPCMLKCSNANMLMCLSANVLTCKRTTSSLSHLPVFLAWLVSSFDATFFSFFAIIIEAVHSDGKIWQFNEYFINRSLLSLCTPK